MSSSSLNIHDIVELFGTRHLVTYLAAVAGSKKLDAQYCSSVFKKICKFMCEDLNLLNSSVLKISLQ